MLYKKQTVTHKRPLSPQFFFIKNCPSASNKAFVMVYITVLRKLTSMNRMTVMPIPR